MKVIGVRTEKYDVEVEVSPCYFVGALELEWKRHMDLDCSWYTNREGFWEGWESRGGFTEVHRRATEGEIEAYKAFRVISHIATAIKMEEGKR